MTPFVHGGIHFPLQSPPTPGRTMVRDADPVAFFLLDYFAWSIRTYVGERLLYEAALVDLPWTDAVAGMVPYDPRPYLRESQESFPLLGIYRVQSAHDDLTTLQRRDVSQLELVYVLPPLNPAQVHRIGPVLNAAKALFDHQAEAGWDADYTPPGGSAGQAIFSDELAGLTDLNATQARFGGYPGTDDLVFPAVMVTIQTTEVARIDAPRLPPFTGADIAVNSTNADGSQHSGTSTGVVDGDPVVTSITPATGDQTGGDIVTLVGGRFHPGATVRFGGARATLVDFSDTALTVRTPAAPAIAAHSSSFAVDVYVRLPSGQSTLLPDAFTYVD